jgi:hypothetical protein
MYKTPENLFKKIRKLILNISMINEDIILKNFGNHKAKSLSPHL